MERGGGTDWCVMSMLSGPLRMTRFPPTPAILLSRDWAQVSVTCGRASGAACDRICSCTKLGAIVAAKSSSEEQRRSRGVVGRRRELFHSHLISSHLFFTSSLPFPPTMDPVVFPEVPPHATPLSRHAPRSLPSSTPSPVLSSADPSDRELDVSEETSSSSQTPATEESFVDPYPDFLWMTTEEPHRSRRIAILKAHPEVSHSRSQLQTAIPNPCPSNRSESSWVLLPSPCLLSLPSSASNCHSLFISSLTIPSPFPCSLPPTLSGAQPTKTSFSPFTKSRTTSH